MRKNYCIVDNEVRQFIPEVTLSDYCIAYMIGRLQDFGKKGYCFATSEYIAEKMIMTPRGVNKCIKRLIDVGLIEDVSEKRTDPRRKTTALWDEICQIKMDPWESPAYNNYLERRDLWLVVAINPAKFGDKIPHFVEHFGDNTPEVREQSSSTSSEFGNKVPEVREQSSSTSGSSGTKFLNFDLKKSPEVPVGLEYRASKVAPRVIYYIEIKEDKDILRPPGELRSFDRATRTEEIAPPTKDFVDTKDFVESTENVRTNLKECLAAEISRKKFSILTDGIPGDYDSIVDKWIKYWIEEMGRGKPTSRKGAASSFEKWCEVERDKTPEGADRAMPAARELGRYMEKKWRWNRKKHKTTDRDIEKISGRVAQGMTIEEGKMIIDYARFGLNSKDTCSTDYLFGRKFEEVKKGAVAFAAKESGWGKRSVRYYPDND